MTMEMNLLDLSEECIAAVIYFTSPHDACRISAVSKLRRSAAETPSPTPRGRNFFPLILVWWLIILCLGYLITISSSVSVNPIFSSMMAERFEEVAALLMVCWFEIRGNISSSMLSKGTVYGAYLVFKEGEIGAFGFRSQPLETSFRYILGSTRTGLCNDRRAFLESGMPEDGWLEIELGEYYVGFDEEELVMSVLETREGGWKGGIIVQEIEIRPK
ncbi:hypothetical protein YC2023_086268 [Brassica napus]|uniref:(rape) hypothetical protein n=1 Tax=Brassica napus TaxID=3708 RepID=A0A816MZV0_BRANA|nr:unnamed protein product [Brassica napus]